MVLLDLGLLVLHLERGHDALGQDPGAEAPGCSTRDASIEDQLHLIRTAEIEILADDFFEETAAGHRSIEDLREGELGLQDGELIAIPGGPVRRREGMGHAPEPLAKDRVNARRRAPGRRAPSPSLPTPPGHPPHRSLRTTQRPPEPSRTRTPERRAVLARDRRPVFDRLRLFRSL